MRTITQHACLQIGAVICAASLLSGCSSKPPACSDGRTLELARKILAKQFMGSSYKGEDISDVLVFESARASNYEEAIKKYTCEAKLIVNAKVEAPIAYTSQVTETKEHVVAVQRYTGNDFLSLAGNFMTGVARKREKAQ